MNEHIGVLMPLQLETKFVPPDGDRPWTMLLRVIPQPPSVNGHARHITAEEQRAASLFRRSVGRTGTLAASWFGTPQHRAAFAVLARSVGPSRAVWLALNTTARRQNGAWVAVPTVPVAEDGPAEVQGLPPHLNVAIWTYGTDGRERLQTIGRLPDHPGTEAIADRLPLPTLTDAGEVFDHWVANWDKACSAGLGGSFPLPDALGPLDLGGVCVWGLGDEAPGPLFTDQISSGALAEVVLGAATHSVQGATTALSEVTTGGEPAADGTPDEESFWQALLRRLAPDAPATSLDELLARYVTGAPVPSIARPRGREQLLADLDIDPTVRDLAGDQVISLAQRARATFAPEVSLAPLLMHALWPVLWGSFARDEWRVDEHTVGALSRWTLQNVNPEGPLPSIRVGEEPYALLPVTRLDAWSPANTAGPPELAELHRAVTGLRGRLHAALVAGGTVRGAGPGRYARLLLRGGASRRFGLRLSGRLDQLATMPWLDVGQALDARRRAFELIGATDLVDRRDALAAQDPAASPFVGVDSRPDAVGLPLVAPERWTFWSADRNVRRVPLPALVNLLRGGPDPIRPPTTQFPRTMGDLFGDQAIFFVPELDARGRLAMPPDSVLARLLLQACLTVNTWRGSWQAADPTLALGDGFGGDGWTLAALQVALLVDPGGDEHHWRKPYTWESVPDSTVTVTVPSGNSVELPAFSQGGPDAGTRVRLERALGAVLDTVSSRADPWITGFAFERLRAAAVEATTERRLGAYGWVYGPFEGTPGPTGSGLLHTPSQAQTLIATMARDAYRQHRRSGSLNERGETPWGIALTGPATRIAYDIVADLRDGHHLYEILGREVEWILTDGAASPYQTSRALRRAHPMYPERPDPRQVCDGERALAALLGGQSIAGVTVSGEQRAGLRQLQAALDALADLQLLDGALHASGRQPARAAATMNGAAGSGAMPEPEYPRTVASGREVRCTVLSVLPWRGAAPTDHAARLAEPSVAAFLQDQLGTDWTWRVRFEDGREVRVSLDRLGLRPIDAVALSPAQLKNLAAVAAGAAGGPVGGATEAGSPDGAGEFAVTISEGSNRTWEATSNGRAPVLVTLAGAGLDPDTAAAMTAETLRSVLLKPLFAPARIPPSGHLQPVPSRSPRVWTVRDPLGTVLGVADAETLGLGPQERDLPLEQLAPRIRRSVDAPAAVVTDPPELARAARLCQLLGSPATEAAFQPDDQDGVAPAAWAELRARYAAVYNDLKQATADLRAAGSPAATEPARAAAIRRGALWGITPDMSPADAAGFAAALTGVPPPRGATSWRVLAASMADALYARRKVSVAPSSIPTVSAHRKPQQDADGLRAAGKPDGIAALARAISTLAAPQGNLPVLPGWGTGTLAGSAPLQAADPGMLEREWLTVLAPVRPALARLEAVQLDAGARGSAALSAWSTGADPWQREEIRLAQQASGSAGLFDFRPPGFTAAFGPAGALDGPAVAVGVIDSYNEALPLRQRDTHAAFGFNAPLARAPQAILLAVPPGPGDPLGDDDIAVMLTELRELMVARSATGPDLAELGGLMRTTWMPADDPVRLFDKHAYANPFG